MQRKTLPIPDGIAVWDSCAAMLVRVGVLLGSIGERLQLAAQDFATEGLVALNQLDHFIMVGASPLNFVERGLL